MENRIVVDFNTLDRIAKQLNTVGSDLEAAMSILSGINPTQANGAYLRLNGANVSLKSVGGTVSAYNVTQAVLNYRSAISRLSDHSRDLSRSVHNTSGSFQKLEGRTGRNLETGSQAPSASADVSEPTKSLFGWSELWKFVGEGGIVGSLISTIGQQITGGTTPTPKRVLQVLKGATKTGERIAKGLSETSFDWKRLVGFNVAINADTPSNYILALKEESLKYSFGNAKNTAGKTAVACKWAGSILTVLTVGYDNWTSEGDKDNSLGRKIGETAIESTVKIGGGMLISAGVTAGLAALGVVGAPAIAVGAATVGISLILNKVSEAITGKDIAENVSDFVFDVLPEIGKNIGNALDSAGKAIGNAIDSAGKAISGWWNGMTGGLASAFGW